MRTIFKAAFEAASLPYFNPHSFRKTLTLLAGEICNSPQEYKAWSQNLGHEDVLTTFRSYGELPSHQQTEMVRSFSHFVVFLVTHFFETTTAPESQWIDGAADLAPIIAELRAVGKTSLTITPSSRSQTCPHYPVLIARGS